MIKLENSDVDSGRSELLRLLISGWVSTSIGTAVELGVADALHSQPRDTATIATVLGVEPGPLSRLLRLLQSLGLVTRDADHGNTLTELGELLRSDHPQSIHNLARLYQEPYFAEAWRALETGVRTGEQPFRQAHGQSVFDYLADRPDALARYSAGIAVGSDFISALPDYIGFDGQCVMDVGGGDGTLLDAILAATPNATGKLVEREAAVGAAGERLERYVTQQRCEVVAGDFFMELPGGSDTIVLCRILHNWNDDEAAAILRNCREALPAGGKLLIIERVVSEQRPTPVTAAFDLHMFVMTSGRERTDEEYRKLLTNNGFEPSVIRELPLEMSVIEGHVR